MANDVAAVFEPHAQPGYRPQLPLEPYVPVVCSYVPPFVASLAVLCSDDEFQRLSIERRSNITQRLLER
jgi:hypothetical protein